jgi:phosphoribosylglycinamide formyltransferase-1
MKRVAVLISGSGSNLQAILDWQTARGEACGYEVVGVLSNRADAYGLARARQAGVETAVLDHTQFDSREAFDAELVQAVDVWQPDLVVLAGFMRILTPVFTDHYLGKAVNIHPSLLPKYRGLHTHRRALDAGDSEHGLSIHFVTSELDGGPLIFQQAIPIHADDTEARLQQRVHAEEHKAYPRVTEALARELVTYENGAAVCHAKNCRLPLDLEHLNALLGLAE